MCRRAAVDREQEVALALVDVLGVRDTREAAVANQCPVRGGLGGPLRVDGTWTLSTTPSTTEPPLAANTMSGNPRRVDQFDVVAEVQVGPAGGVPLRASPTVGVDGRSGPSTG